MSTTRRVFTAGLGSLGLPLTGCGIFGGDEAPPPPDCEVKPVGTRDLRGVGLQRLQTGASYTLLEAEGVARRGSAGAEGGGRPARLTLGETSLRSGVRLGGLFDGVGNVSLDPIAVPPPRASASAYAFTYSGLDQFRGILVAGRPVGPGQVPTAGRLTFSGPADVTISDIGSAGSTQRRANGTVTVVVGLGSGQAVMTLDNLSGPDGTNGLARVEWRGLQLCGARVLSTGGGQARLFDANGADADLVGPPPSSMFDSTLYRSPTGGPPDSLGGALVVQGDLGSVAVLFLAGIAAR